MTLTANQQRIILQVKAGYGFYGMKYKRATTQEQKTTIINNALNL